MLSHLPLPYPDELLYSVIARYKAYFKPKSCQIFTSQIFGRYKAAPSVDLPNSLNAVCEQTWPVWRMSAEDIALRLTLFPYYAYYTPKEKSDKSLQALLFDGNGRCFNLLGLHGRTTKVPLKLRYCRSCRETDLSKYGETYWHRSHQMTGVIVCPEHGELLINSEALFRPIGSGDYIDATSCTNKAHRFGQELCLNTRELAISIKVAKRCQEMLAGQSNSWGKENKVSAYRQAAMQVGLIKGENLLIASELQREFLSFYGEKLLSEFGVVINPYNTYWLRSMFHNFARSYDPSQNVLLQIFFEDIKVNTQAKKPFGHGPWKCPNPYAKHSNEFPIKKLKLNNGLYYGKCDCGFYFSLLRISDVDSRLPVVKRIIDPGPTWAAEVVRLKQSGLPINTISANLHITPSIVKQFLSSSCSNKTKALNIAQWRQEWLKHLEEEPYQPYKHASMKYRQLYNRLHFHDRQWLLATRLKYKYSKKQIEQWRREWSKLLEETQNRSRSAARIKNSKLYMYLSHYDRDWLFSEQRNWNHSRKDRVDWAARDKTWSNLLEAAALRIKQKVPVVQCLPTTIRKEAGLRRAHILENIHHLPLCQSVLNRYSEPEEKYKERRLLEAWNKLQKNGKRATFKWLVRLAGLRHKPLTQNQIAAIDDLLRHNV